ncbi:hypothetical protein [Algivirga pacifica]|uniref:DUF4493 domain-containing protein n=1 Tax=Algivirga pacifica TaxID=1162670 RepID=A0ABP9DK93_9BACT
MNYKNTILRGLLILLTLFSCTSPLKDIELNVSTDVFSQRVLIHLKDPSNAENLFNRNLKIEILDDPQGMVVNDLGKREFESSYGYLGLAIDPSKATDDIRFKVKVSGEGYLTTTIPVHLSPEDSMSVYSANLVDLEADELINGVDKAKKTFELINSEVVTEVDFNTEASEAGASTKVKVAPGTTFKDINGNEISGDGLDVQLVNFDNSNMEAMLSFPGGFSPNMIINENGEEEEGNYFITAGFASIDMWVGDTEVKQFSQPIDIEMTINPDFTNPETGAAIKAGDQIPVWSYDDEVGTWTYHQMGEVVEKDGKLCVDFQTDHLSWYNLDYEGAICYSTESTGAINIVNNNPGDLNYEFYTQFVFEGTDQPVGAISKILSFKNGEVIKLYEAPEDRKVQLVVYKGRTRDSEEMLRTEAFYPCSEQVTVDITDHVKELPPAINLEVIGYCGDQPMRPTVHLSVLKDGKLLYQGLMTNGKITFYNLNINTEYLFIALVPGQNGFDGGAVVTETFTSSNEVFDNYPLPDGACD